MKILRADPHHPIRKRLWQVSIALALIVLVAAVHDTVVRLSDGSPQLSLGEDFLPPYAAGTLVRQGRSSELYAIAPIAGIERHVVAEANLEPLPVYGPFLNPPFFAALYAPISVLPYRQAAAAWLAINLLLLTISTALLRRLLPHDCGRKTWALVPVILLLPVPFWQAMCHQQNTFLSLALLSTTVLLWRSGAAGSRRDQLLAGVAAGLLCYKPQLACAVTLVLILTLGWRALAGVCATGLALLIFTLLAMPGTLTAYLHQLPPTVRWIQTELAYKWGRQVTALSFWRLLIQGQAPGPTHWPASILATITMIATGVAMGIVLWRFKRSGRAGARLAAPLAGRSRPRPASGVAQPPGIGPDFNLTSLIGATIASMPLLMPYYMDYDLLLLAVPAVLFAAEWMRSPRVRTWADRLLLWAWIALFMAMYASPGVAGHTRLNPAVPLIGLVAGASIWRCRRTQMIEITQTAAHPIPVAAAA